MLQRLFLLLAVFVALAGASSGTASAQKTILWPGVTYEQTVQFTNGGPAVLNLLVGPRPDGTTATTLTPVLSNDAVLRRERVTSMQRRLSGAATVAGINADFAAWQSGRVSGMFMRGGELAVAPNPNRSSAGILSDGTLEIRRASMRGTWGGAGALHPIARLNDLPPAGGAAVFLPSFGAATPALPGGTAAVLFPFPTANPGVDLPAMVVELVPAGRAIPIPIGGAVMLATGAAAAALRSEVEPGQEIVVRFDLKPDWPWLVDAVGGGPVIVRNRAPVFRAGEAFTTLQLGQRAPRSAVGQLADGRIVLAAFDGRQPGYSAGLTNFELAQALVRLGAVSAMALDGGGSTTLAFDGKLLNRPSDPGGERAVGSAVMFMYTGVFLPPPQPFVSPDGDGVDDTQVLGYRVVRPSTATVTLTAPDGSVAFTEAGPRDPGSYPLAFPPGSGDATAAVAEGRWTLKSQAVDDLGRTTSMTRTFVVNATLGFVRPERNVLRLPPKGANVRILWKLARQARVGVTIETPGGTVVRAFSRLLYPAGDASVTWNGRDRDKKPVKGGRYLVRVSAVNALGRAEQTRPLIVRRVAAPAP